MSDTIGKDNILKTDFNIESLLVMKGETISNTVEGEVDSQELLHAHYRLAKIFYDKADLIKAQKYFTLASRYITFPRDVYTSLKIHGFLTKIYAEQLDTVNADENTSKALELLEKLPEHLGLSLIHI